MPEYNFFGWIIHLTFVTVTNLSTECFSLGHPIFSRQFIRCHLISKNKQLRFSPGCTGTHTDAPDEIRFFSLWRRLEFHIYLSIIHEVTEITPRSESLPGCGALPLTLPESLCSDTLYSEVCFLQSVYPCMHSRHQQ